MTYTYTPSTLSNTRVDAADILLGIAIGGIVMLHFIEHMNFYQFPELTILDQVVWNAMFFLCGGKMYAIFSLLFGLSFFIQHDNQAQKGKDFRLRFAWRMVLLMSFGLFDLLFFNGDILTVYAACGLLVLPLIRLSNRTLAWIALFLALQPIEIFYLIWGAVDPTVRPLDLGSGELFGALLGPQSHGTIWEVAVAGIQYGFRINFYWAIENGRLTQTLFLFLLGILMGRKRFLYDEGENAHLWVRTMMLSVVFLLVVLPVQQSLPGLVENACMAHSLQVMLTMWRNAAMMLFIVCAVTWTYHCTAWGKRLILIAPYGKMSLTNYLGQSIIGAFIFYGWGLGLYRVSGHTMSLLIGVGCVLLQYVFCRWWLSRHARGPFEALWKRLTWM
ncbi:MAG: DUF418 domain-containing protein [Bacteroidales bacterium]|nr:DUF418 domain-containing protein [Bacteroidales bacterium]